MSYVDFLNSLPEAQKPQAEDIMVTLLAFLRQVSQAQSLVEVNVAAGIAFNDLLGVSD